MFRQFIRHKSILKAQVTKERRAEVIKNLNFENKTLFGPLQKTKKSRAVKNDSAKISEEGSMKSEIYWMIQHEQKTDLTKSSTKKNKKVPGELKKLEEKSLPTTVTESITSSPKTQLLSEIPFSESELKSMPRFPLELTGKLIQDRPAVEMSNCPSVGKILQATMSEKARNALIRWKTLKISELGEEGFADLQKSYLTNGALFHSLIQDYLTTGSPPAAESSVYDSWTSVKPFLDRIESTQIVETHLAHPMLKYRGVVDCCATIDNVPYIIEWKKSDRSKRSIESTYDAPLQLCAYLGMINTDPRFDKKIRKGAVIVAYTNGDPADVYTLDLLLLRKYWMAWLFRLQEYWIRRRDGTLPEAI